MSERKVINKYIPPDFDPSDRFSLPRGPKRPKTVRVMLPFSMRCTTCGEFIHKGRKFNARKESIEDESYLGIEVFRFYVRCVWCSSEITYRTDPKNADYSVELGATRNAEPWRDQERETEAAKIKRQFEEEMNPMKAIENKTVDSKREIDMAEAIEDLRARKAELERLEMSQLLAARPSNPRQNHTESAQFHFSPEDEETIKAAFKRSQSQKPILSVVKPVKKRLDPSMLGVRPIPKDPNKH